MDTAPRLLTRWRGVLLTQSGLLLLLQIVPLILAMISIIHSSGQTGTPSDSNLTLGLSALMTYFVGSIVALSTIFSTVLFLHRFRTLGVPKIILQWVWTLLISSVILVLLPIVYFWQLAMM